MSSTKTTIIYDKSGTILASYTNGSIATPVGIPFIIVDIPDGMMIESVNVATGTPIYSTRSIIISEIDKINSKMDYIAMMNGLDLSVIMDVTLNSIAKGIITTIDGTADNHSTNYVRVYNYYIKGLWGLMAIRNAIGKWITNAEYTTIVKAKEELTSATDTKNPIPIVKA